MEKKTPSSQTVSNFHFVYLKLFIFIIILKIYINVH